MTDDRTYRRLQGARFLMGNPGTNAREKMLKTTILRLYPAQKQQYEDDD
jgi:hypothetical protein